MKRDKRQSFQTIAKATLKLVPNPSAEMPCVYSYNTKLMHRMPAFTNVGKIGALRSTRSVQIT
jgi:hypothetical protein